MKYFFSALVTLSSSILYSQQPLVTNQFLEKICHTLSASAKLTDTAVIAEAFSKHVYPLTEKMNAEQSERFFHQVYFRLQKNCPKFQAILHNLAPNKGEWKKIDSKPTTTASKSDCQKFKSIHSFYYLETSGDTVRLEIDDVSWTDHFKDGTYSLLNLRWMNECEFQIEFVKSNNLIRRNYSVKGDRYNYIILARRNGYFLVSTEGAGTKEYYSFKLHF